MISTITHLPQSLVRVDIQLDLPESQELWARAEKRVAEGVNVDGFRPGKAPLEVVRTKVLAKTFFDEFINLALPKTFTQAVKENKLETIGEPQIELKAEAINDEGFAYSATVAVAPAVVLPELEKLTKIKRAESKVEPKEIEDALKELREMRATEAAVAREARAGDLARVDVQIKKAGVVVADGEVWNYPCLVGRKQILPEVDEALVGLKANDKKEIKVSFPKDYQNKNLAGSEGDAFITMRQVFERTLPELTDDFVKGLGNFESVEDLKKQLEHNLKHEKDHEGQHELENKVFDLLLEKSDVKEVPETSVKIEIDRMMTEIGEDLTRQHASWENYLQHLGLSEEKYRENLRPGAERRARLGFVLRALAKKWALEILPDELRAAVEKMGSQLSNKEELDLVAVKNYLLYQKATRRVLETLVDGPAFLDHDH